MSKVLVFVAGAALGTTAFAQNANMDRAYNAELMSDAGSRTSLMAAAGGAGFSDGLFSISDGTGNNSLNFSGSMAFRYNMSFRDSGTVGSTADFANGFDMPWTRLNFSGTIWNKDLSYKVSAAALNGQGGFGLEEGWARYDYGNGFAVRWGQYRLSLLREFNVDREFQLAMDRSPSGRMFDTGYSQGIEMQYTSDQFRVMASFSDGIFSQNSDFATGNEGDYALTARAEFQAMGNDWKRWDDFTSFKNAKDTGLLIGAGIHWEDGGETLNTQDTQFLEYTLDGSIEGAGWNAFAAFYGQHIKPAGSSSSDNFGAVVQGGIFVSEQVEVFGRWDAFFPDSNQFGNVDDGHFITVGLNGYISPESHAAKATLQVGYSLNDSGYMFSSISDTDTGFLGQAHDGEITVNGQFLVMW